MPRRIFPECWKMDDGYFWRFILQIFISTTSYRVCCSYMTWNSNVYEIALIRTRILHWYLIFIATLRLKLWMKSKLMRWCRETSQSMYFRNKTMLFSPLHLSHSVLSANEYDENTGLVLAELQWQSNMLRHNYTAFGVINWKSDRLLIYVYHSWLKSGKSFLLCCLHLYVFY